MWEQSDSGRIVGERTWSLSAGQGATGPHLNQVRVRVLRYQEQRIHISGALGRVIDGALLISPRPVADFPGPAALLLTHFRASQLAIHTRSTRAVFL